ncbi:MAG: DUF5107 domain-containing protein [Armatimonadetes bacterium]|nr:DUF5107 domain-containing protein [Armatimonadota bacterium]
MVYPLPTIDRVSDVPVDREWDAIYLENEFVEIMVLPEIGGRIHGARDKTNGYDFIYRQSVIKPALVGLTGPWISGGIELNWPQHHRPTTFMPTSVEVDLDDDGSATVWMGTLDVMSRMRAIHGVCLRPGSSLVELKVKLLNSTPEIRTFLWWANVAVRVHEGYQSFFPPDVRQVADHAKRATSSFPNCEGKYYGIDYGTRACTGVPAEEIPKNYVPANQGGCGPHYAANDLSWYANIPVPTSYMAVGSKFDYFGGYDHFASAGIVHVADLRIAPGKKQWTWGNQEFGYAWDRHLTDSDGPYIELMAGVFTDNQPDFSFLAPWETRSFSQYWFPIRGTGVPSYANALLAMTVNEERVAISTTQRFERLTVRITSSCEEKLLELGEITPGMPFSEALSVKLPARVKINDPDGKVLAEFRVGDIEPASPIQPATEPPLPEDIPNQEELYLTGVHLKQYRHATRNPEAYWLEALRRDPDDIRCNNAMGLWHLGRGEFSHAQQKFERAIQRSTLRNSNPMDSESFYNLGRTLVYLGDFERAEESFGKASWNFAWQAASELALGELACRTHSWVAAEHHLRRSMDREPANPWAWALLALVLRQRGDPKGTQSAALSGLSVDPFDPLLNLLAGKPVTSTNQEILERAFNIIRTGQTAWVHEMLDNSDLTACDGTIPIVHYVRAYVSQNSTDIERCLAAARVASADYCFPSRLEEMILLSWAVQHEPRDSNANLFLGNLLYSKGRHQDAIHAWEAAIEINQDLTMAYRNLGLAYFNHGNDPVAAMEAFEQARRSGPLDGRLLTEIDQLRKRIGVLPGDRLRELIDNKEAVRARDDLSVEYASLLVSLDRPDEALEYLQSRRFHPWEGGEGLALREWTRGCLRHAWLALASSCPDVAHERLVPALDPPDSLGEKRHLLANASDVWLVLGDVHEALGDHDGATYWWNKAASFVGDFQEMSQNEYSEMTYFSICALRRLGCTDQATKLLHALENHANQLIRSSATIDYFATSLPTMLTFAEDPQERQRERGEFMTAQVLVLQAKIEPARAQLLTLLQCNPNHSGALDLVWLLDQQLAT